MIVGGGVGGLTLAATLSRRNVRFLLFEREESAADRGAGLLLAPNATAVLQRLGLLDEALRIGHATAHWRILDQQGSVLREVRVDEAGFPALSILRSELVRLLRRRSNQDCLRRGDVRSARASHNRVELMLDDGSVEMGRAVVGADGIRSCVRRDFFGGAALRFRGYVGWRGVTPFVPRGYEGAMLSETWGPGGRFGIAAVDGHRTYWYASANAAENWVDPPAVRKDNLLARFSAWHRPIAELVSCTRDEDILVSRIYDGPALRTWSSGPAVLLGDAAHAMTPNLGQGACLAMEDAWVLGSLIGDGLEPQEAFRRYERKRKGRALAIQRQARALGWVVQAEHPAALALRGWVTPRIPEFLLQHGLRKLFS